MESLDSTSYAAGVPRTAPQLVSTSTAGGKRKRNDTEANAVTDAELADVSGAVSNCSPPVAAQPLSTTISSYEAPNSSLADDSQLSTDESAPAASRVATRTATVPHSPPIVDQTGAHEAVHHRVSATVEQAGEALATCTEAQPASSRFAISSPMPAPVDLARQIPAALLPSGSNQAAPRPVQTAAARSSAGAGSQSGQFAAISSSQLRHTDHTLQQFASAVAESMRAPPPTTTRSLPMLAAGNPHMVSSGLSALPSFGAQQQKPGAGVPSASQPTEGINASPSTQAGSATTESSQASTHAGQRMAIRHHMIWLSGISGGLGLELREQAPGGSDGMGGEHGSVLLARVIRPQKLVRPTHFPFSNDIAAFEELPTDQPTDKHDPANHVPPPQPSRDLLVTALLPQDAVVVGVNGCLNPPIGFTRNVQVGAAIQAARASREDQAVVLHLAPRPLTGDEIRHVSTDVRLAALRLLVGAAAYDATVKSMQAVQGALR